MVESILRAFLVLVLGCEPALVGLATYYAAPAGRPTRSGEPFRLDARTCAVDDTVWEALRGQLLLVVAITQDGQVRTATLCVNDSGYLTGAGRFEFGVRRGVARFWPVGGARVRAGARGHEVVLDLPRLTHFKLTGDGSTTFVLAWRLGLCAGNVGSRRKS